MFGKNRNNLKDLKKQIDIFIVNKDLLEEVYILLHDIKEIKINTHNTIDTYNKKILVDTYECYNKRKNKSVVFDFTRTGNKNFNIIVKYQDTEENIEVYNDNKNIILSKQRKINNNQIYVYVAKYIKNQLYSIDESMCIDNNDYKLKKMTNIRLNGSKGLKKVTIKYNNKAITEEFYKIDYLDTNLNYNNINENDTNFGYTQKLWYQKEYTDCKDELNKKVLVRK